MSSIEGICKQKLRLDSEAVLDSDNQRAVAVAVTQLQRSYEEASAQGGDPAVLDPVADLKLNQLEIVDSVRERQRLIQVDHAALDHSHFFYYYDCCLANETCLALHMHCLITPKIVL